MTAVKSALCCICWAPATDNHHHPPKSKAGDHGDTITLCGSGNANGCHGLAHHNGGNLSLHLGEPWHFTADARAARQINARRRRTALPPIKPGLRYAVIPVEATEHLDALPDEEPDGDGDMERLCELEYREVAQADYTVFRCRAERHQRHRDMFVAAYGKEAERRFREWRLELTDVDEFGNEIPIPITDMQSSRMLTVADNLPEDVARTLGVTKQVNLATAVREGGDLETLLPYAQRLTATAFAAEFLPAKRPKREKSLACPDCGAIHPRSEYAEVADE